MWRTSRRAGTLALLAGSVTLVATGCVEHALRQSRIPFDYGGPPKPPPLERTEGAIWPGETHSGSFLFYDEKARGVV